MRTWVTLPALRARSQSRAITLLLEQVPDREVPVDALALPAGDAGVDVDIDADTCVTRWQGERIDWQLAVGHLFQ